MAGLLGSMDEREPKGLLGHISHQQRMAQALLGLMDPAPMPMDPYSRGHAQTVASTGGTTPVVQEAVYSTPTAKALASALTLPGDVYAGRESMPLPTEMTQEQGLRVADLAGLAMTGGVAGGPRGALGSGPMRKTPELPMDEASRMARARELGYTVNAYHGTRSDFDRFGRVDGGNAYGDGYYFTPDPEVASRYATGENVNRITLPGNADPNVVPAKLRMENPFPTRGLLDNKALSRIEKATNEVEPGYFKRGELARMFDRAYQPEGDNVLYNLPSYLPPEKQQEILRRAGFDSLNTPYGYVVFDPDQIRSRFAAFDPANEGSGMLLGSTSTDNKSAGLLGQALLGSRESSAPIRAYHGSPQDFDRFDLSKVGTGEGTHTYGRGLYLTESEAVAQGYRDKLKGQNPGRVYEVAVHAGPDQFLDWDKILSAQSPAVREKLMAMPAVREQMDAARRVLGDEEKVLGSTAYTRMAHAESAQVASETLRNAGIAGIRYRSAGGRDGATNMVLFEDALVEILRKYGVASFAALPPAVQMALTLQSEGGGAGASALR